MSGFIIPCDVGITLPRVLYSAWSELPPSRIRLESLVAMELCCRFKKHEQSLDVQFLSLREGSEPGISTLLVYSNDQMVQCEFLLKLLPASSIEMLLPIAIDELKAVNRARRSTLQIQNSSATAEDSRILPLSTNCSLGMVVVPDQLTSIGEAHFHSLMQDEEIGPILYIAFCNWNADHSSPVACVLGPDRHAAVSDPNSIPGLRISLDRNRTINIREIIMESVDEEIVRAHKDGPSQWVPLYRDSPTSRVEAAPGTSYHYHDNSVVESANGKPTFLVTACLTSEPMSCTAAYSELIVSFFCTADPNESITQSFELALQGLEWRDHAIDKTCPLAI